MSYPRSWPKWFRKRVKAEGRARNRPRMTPEAQAARLAHVRQLFEAQNSLLHDVRWSEVLKASGWRVVVGDAKVDPAYAKGSHEPEA